MNLGLVRDPLLVVVVAESGGGEVEVEEKGEGGDSHR